MIPVGYPGHSERRHSIDIGLAKRLILKNASPSERIVKLGVRESFKDTPAVEEYLVDAFAKIGLTLKVSYMPFESLLAEIRLKKLNLILKGDAPTNFDPSTSFLGYVNELGERIQGYQNQHLNKLLSEYQSESDPKVQTKLLQAMEKVFFEDVPALPLFYPIFTTWVRDDLRLKNHANTSVRFWNFSFRDIEILNAKQTRS